MKDAAAAAAAGEAAAAAETEALEVEAVAAAAAVAAAVETEEGAAARVEVKLARELEEPGVPGGCRCDMKCISPPCPFGTKNTRTQFWQRRPSPRSRATFFARNGTCADCAGRTASVKTRTSPPPPTWRQPSPGG